MSNQSKKLSYILRHGFEKETGKSLGKNGWVPIQDVTPLGFTYEEILSIVDKDSKGRFEVSEDLIRANQGHSVKVSIDYKKETPPDLLYHGTSIANIDSILKKGLLKMKRHDVHLTESKSTAKVNAFRWRDAKGILLKIDTKSMVSDGFVFSVSNNNVWLIEHVPAKYITHEEWI